MSGLDQAFTWRRRIALVTALAVYIAMAAYGSANASATFDEPVHVTAGVSYWKFDDYRLNPENGNWPQRLVALPELAASVAFPDLNEPAWRQSDMWTLGDQLVFELNDANAVLARARFVVTIAGALFGLLLFNWSRALFGLPGAWVTLIAFVFSPTMLAHGGLATSDLIGAFALVAATWACWRTLHRASPASVAVSVVAVGAAVLSKMSGLLIAPIAVVMVAASLVARAPLIVRWRGGERSVESVRRKLPIVGALMAVHVVCAWLLIWASFGFRYSAFAPGAGVAGDFIDPWPTVLADQDLVARTVEMARATRILPEAFLYGIASVNQYGKHRASFLNGTLRNGGTPWFFPYAGLVKSTIPMLLLVLGIGVATIAVVIRRRARAGDGWLDSISVWRYETIPLMALIAVYGAAIVSGSLNIGHRHMLPLIAAGMVLLGAAGGALGSEFAAGWVARDRISLARLAVPLLLLWHAGASLMIAPHYLAYFNALAGGPDRAYRHLVDSSLDWGQDLPALRDWLARNGLSSHSATPAYLAYFGRAMPGYYGVDARPLPGFPDRSAVAEPTPLEPGVYCISATLLQSVYSPVRAPWSAQYVHDYNATLDNLRLFDSTAVNPSTRAALIAQTGEAFWARSFELFEQLRFARLASVLRARAPDAEVGHSILVYRVTGDELQRALAPTGRDPTGDAGGASPP